MEIATLGGGCFWCTEGIFKEINGVVEVTSGYSGGNIEDPSYQDVSIGKTNHAEVIQIKFDPNIVSYEDILYIFLKTHDPTTLNKQGHDIGTQYRSVIFFHSQKQKDIAENSIKKLQKDYNDKIVTEVLPFGKFYKAEDYHQDYYQKNPNQMYCRLVIDPKIQKLRKDLKNYLKTN